MPYFTCPSCSLRLYTAAVTLRREECPRCGAAFKRTEPVEDAQSEQLTQVGDADDAASPPATGT